MLFQKHSDFYVESSLTTKNIYELITVATLFQDFNDLILIMYKHLQTRYHLRSFL